LQKTDKKNQKCITIRITNSHTCGQDVVLKIKGLLCGCWYKKWSTT